MLLVDEINRASPRTQSALLEAMAELEGEYGDYWLARNRNAHAWAEAYDEDRQRWVLVEATPGMQVPYVDEPAVGSQAVTAQGVSRSSRGLAADYPWLVRRWLGRRWQSLGKRLKYPLLFAWPGSRVVTGWISGMVPVPSATKHDRPATRPNAMDAGSP